MKLIALIATVAIAAPAFATEVAANPAASKQLFSILKCNTLTGKTLWASFGKRKTSGSPEVTLFPTELTVFASREQLQDRQVIDRTADALKIVVKATPVSIQFAFDAKSLTGGTQLESFDLRLHSPRSRNAFTGTWTTTKDGVVQGVQVFCSAY
jgi:hypothetical protein